MISEAPIYTKFYKESCSHNWRNDEAGKCLQTLFKLAFLLQWLKVTEPEGQSEVSNSRQVFLHPFLTFYLIQSKHIHSEKLNK